MAELFLLPPRSPHYTLRTSVSEARPAQSAESEARNLAVVGVCPTVGGVLRRSCRDRRRTLCVAGW